MRQIINYRNVLKLFLVAISIGFVACTDDDDDVIIDNHDSNKMMQLMHQNMDSMNNLDMTHDPDNDFALMMKVHHKGAIDMAQLVVAEGKDSTIRRIANKIITDQQREIMMLDSFLNAHAPSVMDNRLHDKAHMRMEMMGRNADLQIINGDVDHDFAILMIPHHQSAIDMAQLLLLYGRSEKLKAEAEKMIMEQEKEIMQLQDWLLE